MVGLQVDLTNFDLELKYKTGKTNVDADCLSRLPKQHAMLQNTLHTENKDRHNLIIDQNCLQAICEKDQFSNYLETLVMSCQVDEHLDGQFTEFDPMQWRIAQRKDPVIGPFVRFVTEKSKPNITQVSNNTESKILLTQFDQLVLRRGVLYSKILVENTEKYQLFFQNHIGHWHLKVCMMTWVIWAEIEPCLLFEIDSTGLK